jgi:methionine sulfoxide reductase heme-binding subunit
VIALAASTGSASWYLARGTGVVSLFLFTAVMVLGLAGQQRFSAGGRMPRFAVDTLHREISLLAVAVLVVHIVTSVLDGFAPISLLDAVIPFGSPYRPLWLGFGALALDLMLAVVLTSLLRRRLGFGAWRAIHWLAYLSWPVAVLHGLGTGTDTRAWWMLALTAACVTAVTLALLVRVANTRSIPVGGRALAAGGTLAVCLGVVAFTLAGPLQPHWSHRAGTPASLLGGGVKLASTSGVRVSAQTVPFEANLSGTLRQSGRPGGEVLDFMLQISGGARGVLRIRIAGLPLSGGGVSMVGSQVALAVAGLPSAAQGRIVALAGANLAARVTGSTGGLDLRIALADAGAGRITGTLQATRTGSGG